MLKCKPSSEDECAYRAGALYFLFSSTDEMANMVADLLGHSISDDDLHGPTVKIYFEVVDGGGRSHQLGWKREHDSNRFIIKTRYIKPIGRVIGVYRSLAR